MERLLSETRAEQCVTPRRKRVWAPGSVTNAYSAKRRRVSIASSDITDELLDKSLASTSKKDAAVDRFIPARQDAPLPLDVTPRTQRIARVFGLADDRVLRFSDTNLPRSGTQQLNNLRTNFSKLLYKANKVSPTSAASHLSSRKQFLLALDGPGIPSDPFAFPLSWSQSNVIAVACGRDIYYQDLHTRDISHLCRLINPADGRPVSVEWSSVNPSRLALGTNMGSVQLWDVQEKAVVSSWRDVGWQSVGGLSWSGDMLAVGIDGGSVNLYDDREYEVVASLTLHQSKVHGVKWSQDGNYLATSDQDGIVCVWDARASKVLSHSDRVGGRIRHGAPVKSLAWCPWQPDLLATGSTFPDGKIRIFSTKSPSPILTPQRTISLNCAVTSLHWSPHCKELLSTHGNAWAPDAPTITNGRPVSAKSPITNSITVHSYPSSRRIVSIQAHSGAVGYSCLSPDGTMVFTLCPAEEAMKMWRVWGARPNVVKRETSFDNFRIR